jgi:hypothetical protein
MDDFDFSNLPDDPQVAFVAIEKVLQEQFNKRRKTDRSNGPFIEYMTSVKAAAEELGLDFLKKFQIPSMGSPPSTVEIRYRELSAELSGIAMRIRISRAQIHKQFSISLTETDKIKIRHFVDQIKIIIDQSRITVAKRDALSKKINAFLAEVDRTRTSSAVFSDLAIGLAHIGGEVANELEPARKWVDSIARLLGHYRDIEDVQRALPPPPKQLAPPVDSDGSA